MIVKTIKHFGDKTTGDTYKEQLKRETGDIFECDDNLANERIETGFVKKASNKEIKEYQKQQEQLEKDRLLGELHKLRALTDDDMKMSIEELKVVIENETKMPITLEEATIEQLIQIAKDENISLSYPKNNTAKDVIIKIINKVRAERSEQSSNGGEE